MEKYMFSNKYEVNSEFINKLCEQQYVIRKITIYLDKEIDKNNYYNIFYFNNEIEYFESSIEYYNNKVSFICDSKLYFNSECFITGTKLIYNDEINKKNKFNICLRGSKMFDNEVIYNFIEVEICKPILHISKYMTPIENTQYEDDYKIVIESNYFQSFDDLIKYIMDVSGLNYELSKQHILLDDYNLCYYKLKENYKIDKTILYKK